MAVFLVTAFLVIVFALAVLLLVASDASARAGGDQTHLALRMRRVLRHLNGEADPPAALAQTLIVRDSGEAELKAEEAQPDSDSSFEEASKTPVEAPQQADDPGELPVENCEHGDIEQPKTETDESEGARSDGRHLAA